MTFTKNMFNEIKESLSKKNENVYKDLMRFEPGKTYTVRLVPDVQNPKQTIYHYYHHSWKSHANGQFVTALCPTTYGDTCPIDSYVLKTYNTGSEAEKKKLSDVSRKESWLVNAYVISDPTNPDNEGKVKVIRYGKELAKIITNAIDGDDAEEFGVKIFDVNNGCTFRIKCESRAAANNTNRMMTTYTSSKFLSPSPLDLDEKKLEAVHAGIFDLKKFTTPKTSAELQRMLEQHFFCIQDIVSEEEVDSDTVPETTSTPSPVSKREDALNNIFAGIKESTSNSEKVSAPAEDDTDAKLKELLAGL